MSPQLLSITRQLSTLTWRDRLILLGQILRSFLPMSNRSLKMTQPDSSELSSMLDELQQICTEEDYTLEVPVRINRVNSFSSP